MQMDLVDRDRRAAYIDFAIGEVTCYLLCNLCFASDSAPNCPNHPPQDPPVWSHNPAPMLPHAHAGSQGSSYSFSCFVGVMMGIVEVDLRGSHLPC
jgi:hypothetical protein